MVISTLPLFFINRNNENLEDPLESVIFGQQLTEPR